MHDATAAVYAYDVKAEKVLTFMTPFVTWIMFLLNIVVLLTGSVAENLRWGDENATEEELRLAAELAQAEEFVDALPKGFDYDLGQGGRECFRRTETAPLYCARAAEKAQCDYF